MWANEYERIKILAQEMVKAQQEQAEARSYTPVREAKPPKPKPQSKFKAGSQEWFKALPEPPSLVDQIAAGAICMRTMGQSVPKPKLPRRPRWVRRGY